jgi:hypothetical protein
VHVQTQLVDLVRGILGDLSGVVVKEGLSPVGLHVIETHVRSTQVVGLQEVILSAVGESAYVYIWFDQWEEFEGDQEALVRSIRERKGLSDTIPSWETVSSRFLSPKSILTFYSSVTQSNRYVRPHATKKLPVYSSACSGARAYLVSLHRYIPSVSSFRYSAFVESKP